MDKLDILLKNHPIKTPVRESLVADTMVALPRIKQVRRAKTMIVVFLIISLILFIGKWLGNDLLYFIQLILYKFAIIKIQSGLYWGALVESFPKYQLVGICLAALLWIGWKKFETSMLHGRITNRMIRITPRLLFVTGLITLTSIGFAGYSYAQKTEQKQLQILREHINQSGRTEFEMNVPTNQCDANNNPNLTNQYEIKKGTNITSGDLVKIIEAACNNAEAEKFLWKRFPFSPGIHSLDKSIDIVSQVVERNNDVLSLVSPGVAYNPNPEPMSFTLTKDTKIYKDKKLVSQHDIKKENIVILMIQYQYANEQGRDPLSKTVLGVYILPTDPEFKWYDLDLQHSITQIEMCLGNPQDRCTFTGGIDLFPSGGGEANTMNPLYKQSTSDVMKLITGVLTEINDMYVKIKSSSGRVFTVKFGSDPITEFNKDRAQEYNNQKIGLGDTLLIRYSESATQHSTTLETKQIFNAVLMIEVTDKFDPIKKY